MRKSFSILSFIALAFLLSACSSQTSQTKSPDESLARKNPSPVASTQSSPEVEASTEPSVKPFASVPANLDSKTAKEVQEIDKMFDKLDQESYSTQELNDL